MSENPDREFSESTDLIDGNPCPVFALASNLTGPPLSLRKDPFEMIQDRVMIEQDKSSTRTPGGLYLPEHTQTNLQTATVIAVGPGMHKDGVFVKVTVKPGARVLCSKYAGAEVSYQGHDYRITSEAQIFCVLHGDAAKQEELSDQPQSAIPVEATRVHV